MDWRQMTEPRYTKEAETLLVLLANNWLSPCWNDQPEAAAAQAFLDAMKGERETPPRFTPDERSALEYAERLCFREFDDVDSHQVIREAGAAHRTIRAMLEGGDCPAQSEHETAGLDGLPVAGAASTAPPEPKADERTVEETIENFGIAWRDGAELRPEHLNRILAAHRAEVEGLTKERESWQILARRTNERKDELQRRIDVAKAYGKLHCPSKITVSAEMARILEGELLGKPEEKPEP
jgi:hypothetical protein